MISLAPINPLSGNKMSFAYYNEIDPYAAQWLRNLGVWMFADWLDLKLQKWSKQ